MTPAIADLEHGACRLLPSWSAGYTLAYAASLQALKGNLWLQLGLWKAL